MKAMYTVLFCIAALTVSCVRRNDVIRFDDSEPLALAPDILWALVVVPYAGYCTEPSWEAAISGHCRRGDILQIESKSIARDASGWYRCADGWLPESAVIVYTNRYRAVTKAQQLE